MRSAQTLTKTATRACLPQLSHVVRVLFFLARVPNVLVLVVVEFVDEEVSVLKGQLLPVLALHDGEVLVHGVEGEVVQVAELVLQVGRLPLHREVLAVRQRVRLPLEVLRLAVLVRQAHHFAESLVPAALVHRENQVDVVCRVKGVLELLGGSVGGGPDALLLGEGNGLLDARLHDEELGFAAREVGGLLDAFFPDGELGAVDARRDLVVVVVVVLMAVVVVVVVVLVAVSSVVDGVIVVATAKFVSIAIVV